MKNLNFKYPPSRKQKLKTRGMENNILDHVYNNRQVILLLKELL